MKLLRIFILTLVFLPFTQTMTAKGKLLPKAYMFGFSASFKDSLVYFTEIQELDSVWIDSKSKFLFERDAYSYQLKNHFIKNYSQHHRTCIVVFDKDRKKIEKKYSRLRATYAGKSKFNDKIKYLGLNDFKFQRVEISFDDQQGLTNE